MTLRPKHILFFWGGGLSIMHALVQVSTNIRHLKCLTSQTPKIWYWASCIRCRPTYAATDGKASLAMSRNKKPMKSANSSSIANLSRNSSSTAWVVLSACHMTITVISNTNSVISVSTVFYNTCMQSNDDNDIYFGPHRMHAVQRSGLMLRCFT